MEEYKPCKNCFYYRAHYAKDDMGILYDLNEGHCTNKRVPIMNFKRAFKYECGCNFWETDPQIKQEINIGETLKTMIERLEILSNQLADRV